METKNARQICYWLLFEIVRMKQRLCFFNDGSHTLESGYLIIPYYFIGLKQEKFLITRKTRKRMWKERCHFRPSIMHLEKVSYGSSFMTNRRLFNITKVNILKQRLAAKLWLESSRPLLGTQYAVDVCHVLSPWQWDKGNRSVPSWSATFIDYLHKAWIKLMIFHTSRIGPTSPVPASGVSS